ncbi:hypothetical protein Tco_0540764 [Tanacetum coccineum]
MGSNEETNAAGTDTRPPMLVESDYDSWKIRIHRYIRGKPNGKLIWKSIQNGPTPHPMITDPPPTDSAAVPAPRKKLDSEFSEEENKLEMADTQAEIILSQGLPRHIFNNLNQTITSSAKLLLSNYIRMKHKFVNNLPDLLGTYAKMTLKKQEQSYSIVIHAYVASHKSAPALSSPSTLLYPPNNKLRLPPTQDLMYGCMMCKNPRGKMDSQYFKDKALLMEAKEKGDVLDAEAEAFLADVECTAPYDQPQALTTTNMFQANHEDGYGL